MKKWEKFMMGIIAILVCTLVFILVYEVVVEKDKTNQSKQISGKISVITLYDKDGNIMYQCQSNNDIQVQIEDNELDVYVPYEPCSCFEEGLDE